MTISPIINKIITADPDTFIIFFVRECIYCEKALELLRSTNSKYKGYNINTINGGLEKLLNELKENAEMLNYNPNHRTKPIIFYDKKFIGGLRELTEFMNNKK